MQRLRYTQFIPATPAHVWEAFVGKETYPQWTEAFVPGAHYKGEWKEGGTIMAVSPNPDGTEDGLYSKVLVMHYAEHLEVEHLGIVRNNVLYEDGVEALDWKGGKEVYSFLEVEGGTELRVLMDVHEDWAEHFQVTWPVALQRLSEIAIHGESTSITIYTWVTASIEQVWKCYTDPKHILGWQHGTTEIVVDLREGGTYTFVVYGKSMITQVRAPSLLLYQLENGQRVDVQFAQEEEYVAVRIRFDKARTSTRQQQCEEWQRVLHTFKEYVEAQEML